jgi:hypothetical protein
VAFSSTVAAKILGHAGNYFCQQAMLLLLRFSDLTQRPKQHTGFWLSGTSQKSFKRGVFIMKCVVAVYALYSKPAYGSSPKQKLPIGEARLDVCCADSV